MNADGIAYLDIGDAYMRGDWQNAINPVWSPLYSWILGLVMSVIRPPMAWEFAVVHLVNLGLFLFSFLCFEYFWRQLGHYRQSATDAHRRSLPDWAWLTLGYALFIWVTLSLIAIWAVTPDMLMAGLVLLAAGLVARFRTGHLGWSSFLLLGLVLGLAYLAKAIMFPLGFVFLAVAWATPGELRRTTPRAAAALVVFLLVCLPYILVISRSHGSLTFGEAGTITYLRHVLGITDPHWRGDGKVFGNLSHPSRQLLSYPPVYEFAEPIGGTYPISYNPAYWYEGVTIPFDPGRQFQALVRNGIYYFELFGWQQGGLLTLVGLLYAVSSVRLPSLLVLVKRWGLLLAALTAFLLYGLVYAEGRYLGVFIVLLWADLFANIALPDSSSNRRIVRIASLLITILLLANIVAFNLEGYGRLSEAGNEASEEAPPAQPVEVAETLWQLGVDPGSPVGVIGYAYDAFWARLARVRIVAELVDWPGNPFWYGGPGVQHAAVEAFTDSGACAVVAEHAPDGASLPGWIQVKASSYYVYLLPENC